MSDYTWIEERISSAKKDVAYRVPGRAYVGPSWSGWYHISLYVAAEDRWVRENGVYSTASEAIEWAELLLTDADENAPQAQTFTVSWTVTVTARTPEEAEQAAKNLRDRAVLTVIPEDEVVI